MLGFLLYSGYTDYQNKIRLRQENILQEIEQCKADYTENQCEPEKRAPALYSYCKMKERCINRDPFREAVKLTGIGEIIKDFCNSMFEGMSIKTICCLAIFVLYPSLIAAYYIWGKHREKLHEQNN